MVVKLLSAAAIAAAATSAQGAFTFGSADFGGGFVGTNGSPLVPVGGTILAQTTTDPATHALFVGAGLAATGWGTTFGAIEDNAPTHTPYSGGPGTVLDSATALGAIVPAAGAGGATASFFGGFYARGPITTTDDDAFVARIAVSSGATLATSGGVVIAVQGLGDASESNLIIDESGVIGSTGVGDNRTDGANYQLLIVPQGSYALGDVFDVFVVVPTPGTAALFGVAGLATIRRRRA